MMSPTEKVAFNLTIVCVLLTLLGAVWACIPWCFPGMARRIVLRILSPTELGVTSEVFDGGDATASLRAIGCTVNATSLVVL